MNQPIILAIDRVWRDYTPAELRRRRIPGRRTEQCPECGELFAGTSVGDAHRYGPYTARGCLTRAEMTERGMWTDDRDVWHLSGGPGVPGITPTAQSRAGAQGGPVPEPGSAHETASESILAGFGGGAA